MNTKAKEQVLKINKGEVPQGYKKTKLGIIPEDWSLKNLGSLGEFKKGKGISIKDTIETGLPAMMYGDIYVKYNTQFNNVDFRINQNTAQNSTKVNKGDLLFTGSGETAIEIGKCITYQGEEPIYIGGDIIGLTPEKNDSLFLAYQQNSYEQIKQKARFGQGHSVVHIYTHHIKSLIIALPPLLEQQKIAEILSTCDKVIELKEKLIEQKKLQKKYLMQAFLNPKSPNFRRLPGFDKDWEEVELGSLGEFKTSSVDKKDYENQETVELLNYMDVYRNPTIDNSLKLIKVTASIEQIKTFGLGYGDILFTPSSETPDDIGHSAVFKRYKGTVLYSYHLVRMKLIKKMDIDFRGYIFNVNYLLNEFSKRATGATRYTLSLKDFKEVFIKLPKDVKEQAAIAKILSMADQGIGFLEKELKQQKLKKKALMQLLLTGKVRVNVS